MAAADAGLPDAISSRRALHAAGYVRTVLSVRAFSGRIFSASACAVKPAGACGLRLYRRADDGARGCATVSGHGAAASLFAGRYRIPLQPEHLLVAPSAAVARNIRRGFSRPHVHCYVALDAGFEF